MSVRAKFTVESVTNHAGGGNTVNLHPVHATCEENKAFWQATPSGKLEMNITILVLLISFSLGLSITLILRKLALIDGRTIASFNGGLLVTK